MSCFTESPCQDKINKNSWESFLWDLCCSLCEARILNNYLLVLNLLFEKILYEDTPESAVYLVIFSQLNFNLVFPYFIFFVNIIIKDITMQ